MSHLTTRGAAAAIPAALLVASAAGRMDAQVAAGGVRPRDRAGDSVVVRVIDSSFKARLDSLGKIWIQFEGQSPASRQSAKLRAAIEMMVREMAGIQATQWKVLQAPAPDSQGGVATTRVLLGSGEPFFGGAAFPAFKGWIGITTAPYPHWESVGPDGRFIRFFRYPPIISVAPNSPAQRAGIVPGDVLIAYDGVDLVSRMVNMSSLLVPERKLSVTVLRDGANKEYSLTVAPPPPDQYFYRSVPGVIATKAPPFTDEPMQRAAAITVVGGPALTKLPVGFVMTRAGVFGASLSTVNPELAKVLKIETGVLVTEVPEGTPAFRAGLRIGDVITLIAGQPVATVIDVQNQLALRSDERAIEVQVVRDKKARQLTFATGTRGNSP